MLFLFFIQHVRSEFRIYYSEIYYNMRNSMLKKIIYEDKMRAKMIVKTTKMFYNKLVSKYYEMNEKYYTLNENDRTLIETILSLAF